MNELDARTPTVLRAIAVLGVVVAIVGAIAAWQFLSDLEETTDRSLLIGEQATVTLEETIDVADSVLVAVDEGLLTVESTLGTLQQMLESTSGLADASGELSATLPQSLADIDAALLTVQRLGETVDSTLARLSDLPFGPNYDPAVPFPDAIANVRQALDPIGEQLDAIAVELQEFANGSGDLDADIVNLRADLDRTREALSGTDELLDRYREAAADAGRLAVATRNDLAASVDWMRFLLVVLALLLAVSQLVPWTLAAVLEGRRLAEPDGEAETIPDDEPAAIDVDPATPGGEAAAVAGAPSGHPAPARGDAISREESRREVTKFSAD